MIVGDVHTLGVFGAAYASTGPDAPAARRPAMSTNTPSAFHGRP